MAATAHATERRAIGRPPRPIRRSNNNVPLEANVAAALREQAQHAELAFSTYCELVISIAHGYDGPFLPEIDLLPAPLTRAELQARVRELTRADVAEIPSGLGLHGIRVDSPLAIQMRARSQGWGVPLARYLRGVLHIAAAVRPQHVVQDQLLDVPDTADAAEGRRRAS